MKTGSKILIGIGLVLFCGAAFLIGSVLHYVGHKTGGSAGTALNDIVNPRSAFPQKADRINILCMGIDDNWTDSDKEFSTNARTDTLFWMSLDLANKKIYMLSIPRDSYVPIAGTDRTDKVNYAYASGGPARSEYTVRDLFGVMPDYYLLLNINATKAMVDTIGGVDVNVEHEMDYDDNWGHLHVHLMPGFQHLNGDQAVAFARFRHANHGTTFEDGDERRIYRQHVLMRAMVEQIKQPENWLQLDNIVNVGLSNVRTDLSREQLLALGSMFHGVPQENITAASLVGDDKMVGNASVFLLDEKSVPLYVGWLIQGNDADERALTPVIVKNGTSDPTIAQQAMDKLSAAGYHVIVGSPTALASQTTILDTGVPDLKGAAQVAACIGIPNAPIIRKPVQPNHKGWSPDPTVTVTVGQDYVSSAPATVTH